ncbi:g12039 [Coccomyxa viridis]|uniref:G12039 protein n=1 Tax=Coccomyxa viridis TaxID=1274662 RepID=A0ABP1GC09_9CHLO
MAMYQRPRARRGAADLQNEVDGTTRVTTQDERLAEARQALHSAYSTLQSGNPVQALQDLLRITRFLGGSEGPLLRRAVEALSQGNSRGTDDLARLLEQCNLNIDRQEPPIGQSTLDSSASSMDHDHDEAQESASMPGNQHDPILAETGREGITGAALDDGSSFICTSCGGVVSLSREAAHREYWCSGANGG